MMQAPQLITLALLALALPGASLSAPRAAVPAAQGPEDVAQFKKDFDLAMGLNDLGQMADLVKTNHGEALSTVIETCEAIGVQTSEKLERRIDALRKAWQRAHDERFVDNMYEYLALMRASFRKHRGDLKAQWDSNKRAFFRAAEAKEEHAFPGLAVEFTSLAKGFEEIADHYHAAECWRFAAFCNEEAYIGEANYEVVYDYIGRFMAAREKVDLRDSVYNTLKARREAFVAGGLAGEEEEEVEEAGGEGSADGTETGGAAPGQGGKPGGKDAATPPVDPSKFTAAMTFEMVKDLGEFKRPAYHADELFPMWNVIELKARGSTNTIYTMRESPTLIRTAELIMEIDLDGDAEGDMTLPLTGNLEPIEMTLGHGSDKRGWGMLAAIASNQQFYQGITVNLAPQPGYLSLFFFNAASVVGDLGGTALRIFDDNLDGDYGSFPKTWNLVGLAEGNFHPQMDSMILGRGKKAVPYSEFVQLGDGWYKLEPAKNGMEMVATLQKKMKTGRLALGTKGVKPDYLVVQGTGKWANCYFDLTEGGSKGIEVPAGTYKVFSGRISKGKRVQMMKAQILPGESKGIDVSAGETATFEMGAPYSFAFDFTADGENVTVRGASVVVQGRGGEAYDRIWNAVTRPDVLLRKKGKKKGGKGKQMRIVENQTDPILGEVGFGAMWRPLDLSVEQSKVGDEFEVQLVEKKNKLFGSIESPWN